MTCQELTLGPGETMKGGERNGMISCTLEMHLRLLYIREGGERSREITQGRCHIYEYKKKIKVMAIDPRSSCLDWEEGTAARKYLRAISKG